MANTIKIGSIEADAIKMGTSSITKVYVGTELVYPNGGGRLPQGYTEVEYVENTGSSSVNLGVQLQPNVGDSFEVVLDNEMTWTSGGENFQTFLTCQKEVSPYPGWNYRFDNNGIVSITTSQDYSSNRTLISGNVYHTIISGSSIPSTQTHTNPLNLFSSLDANLTPWRFCKGKLYNLTATYNGNLVRDLVPCINPSNVAGFYDLVGETFYTTVNNVPLVAGNPV